MINVKARRIIPCLDVCNGKVVKGINFIGFREIGDPVEYAIEYEKQGADEIVFLDITATNEGRRTMIDLVRETAKNLTIPFIVGGGVRDVEDMRRLFEAGASKVSLNTAAVKRPELLREAASKFGKERPILAVDGKRVGKDRYNVIINGGKKDTGKDLLSWVKQAEELGAGEILLTSIDADGAKRGFDLPMLNAVCDAVEIPVIASGGCGTVGHFVKVFLETGCDAALAASIFHYGDLTVSAVKRVLKDSGISVHIKGGACA